MSATTGSGEEQAGVSLLVDLPNLNGTVRKHMPKAWSGPACDFQRLAMFAAARGTSSSASSATVFMNYREVSPRTVGLVEGFRRLGFGVFAKPKRDNSDIDDDIVQAIGVVAFDAGEVLVLTHDRGLLQRCLDAVQPGTAAVTVLGLSEHSAWARSEPRIRFIDLAEIDGLLPAGIQRHDLRYISREGQMLAPLQPLTCRSRRRTAAAPLGARDSAGAA